MKCKICDNEVKVIRVDATVVKNINELVFNFCPVCHLLYGDDGNVMGKCDKVPSNEEDFLRWILSGGSNMASGT